MYGIKLCVFTSVFLCCPGDKWQMSGSRVGLSAPLSPAVTFWRFYRDIWRDIYRDTLPRYSGEIRLRDPSTEVYRDTSACLEF